MTLTTTDRPNPNVGPSSGLILTTGDRASSDTHEESVLGGDVLTGGQSLSDSHSGLAPGDILDPDGHLDGVTQSSRAVGVDTSAGAMRAPMSNRDPLPAFPAHPTRP